MPGKIVPSLSVAQVLEPVPIIAPAYLLAGGALFGVLVTIVVQLIQARIQRQHDRQGRAFDARFELYSSLLVTLDDLSAATAKLQQLLDQDEVDKALAAADNYKAAQRAKIEALEEASRSLAEAGSSAEGQSRTRSPEEEAIDEQLDSARKDYETAMEVARTAQSRLHEANLPAEEAFQRFRIAIARVKILSGTDTINSAAILLDRFHKKEQPTNDEERAFLNAARKELGIK